MHLSPPDVALLEATVEIEIETQADDASPVHRTIIWVVTDGPDAFIRSVNGTGARWFREAGQPRGRDPRRRPADPRPGRTGERSGQSVARTSAALERKYAGDVDLPSMLVPKVLDTTLRLEPA